MKESFKAKFIFILAFIFVFLSQNTCLAMDNLVNKKQSLVGTILSKIVPGAGHYSVAETYLNSKLDSALNKLVKTAEQGVEHASALAESTGFKVMDNKIWVLVLAKPDQWEEVKNLLLKTGAEGLKTSMRWKNRLRCWLPITSLEAVAADDAVSQVRRPRRIIVPPPYIIPQSKDIETAGSATTEALSAMGVPAWHDADHKGQGIKIAVIDVGFLGYTALKGTDLPLTITVKNFVEGEDPGAVDGKNVHGTACAEIIHDIAPLSELYLVKVDEPEDMEDAVTWLISQEVEIVSVSVGWIGMDAGDGETPTGLMAEEITRARNNGLLFVTSAGNDRKLHWGGLFDPLNVIWQNPITVNVWGDTLGYINCFGSSGTNFPNDCDLIPSGENIPIYLRWADWGSPTVDMDLHLTRWDNQNSEWVVVKESLNYQTGLEDQEPQEEIIDYTSTGDPTYYGFFIKWYGYDMNNPPAPVNLDLFAPIAYQNTNSLRHYRAERSISGGVAEASAAVTVTAVNVSPPYAQEDYSNEGPRNGPGGTAEPATAQKPDLAGYANVSTVSYGPTNFPGTSAAAPHVAGALALILENYDFSSFTKAINYLNSRAKPLGDPGWDTIYGHGRVHMGSPDDTQRDFAAEAIFMLLLQ